MVAVLALVYQSHRTGRSWRDIIRGSSVPKDGQWPSTSILPPREKISFLNSQPIGQPLTDDTPDPRITNVGAVDLDQDGLLDVILCDALEHRISWIRQHPPGIFATEIVCAPKESPIPAPAHVEAVDFDRDGDLDLLVASLGKLTPSNEKIGSVVILENDGAMHFSKRVVSQGLMRVADVRAGDLDGDGDYDLAVAMFGAFNGGTSWLENLGDWTFVEHVLQSLSGPINCPVIDIEGDGDLDIALLVSQEHEEIHLFINDGGGHFEPKLIWGATNEDFGSAHLRPVDLDGDGDIDLLYTNGDAWDYYPAEPRPWHGVHWLENQGNLQFTMHRLVTFGGPYSALPMDVDRDGDLDVVATSMFNDWELPSAQSIIWLENNGRMQFARRDVTNTPTHIQTAAAGDFNGDGLTDFVTGGVYTDPPHDRRARVQLWTNLWSGPPGPEQDEKDRSDESD